MSGSTNQLAALLSTDIRLTTDTGGKVVAAIRVLEGEDVLSALSRAHIFCPNTDDEAILIAEIDLGQVVRGKFDLDVVGHYSRPDIFQLYVDERPKKSVTLHGPEADDARDCDDHRNLT